MAARFPFLPVASVSGEAFLMPILPLELKHSIGESVQIHGLIDSGATVNVLPYSLGFDICFHRSRFEFEVAPAGSRIPQ
jgi:hypothetical protein